MCVWGHEGSRDKTRLAMSCQSLRLGYGNMVVHHTILSILFSLTMVVHYTILSMLFYTCLKYLIIKTLRVTGYIF